MISHQELPQLTFVFYYVANVKTPWINKNADYVPESSYNSLDAIRNYMFCQFKLDIK